jgi:hypothetical protein
MMIEMVYSKRKEKEMNDRSEEANKKYRRG